MRGVIDSSQAASFRPGLTIYHQPTDEGILHLTLSTNEFPVLPLRDIVVFPHMIVPLFVGREKSVRALEDVMKDDKQILLVAQKNAAQDDPVAMCKNRNANPKERIRMRPQPSPVELDDLDRMTQ